MKCCQEVGKISITLVLITSLVFGVWFYSGWPRIWKNPPVPPEVQEARAISCGFGTDIGGGQCRGFLDGTPGSNQTWNVPSDWTDTNSVECIGAGGGGATSAGGNPGASGGGGGGGGAPSAGRTGGLYGAAGGGGGKNNTAGAAGGAGKQGLIVITYTPAAGDPSVSCSVSVSSTGFGTLDPDTVSTSTPDIILTTSCSDTSIGCIINATSTGDGVNGGLYAEAVPKLIPSPNAAFDDTAALSAGTEGYGIQATTTANININPRYDFATTTHTVGKLATTTLEFASSTENYASSQIFITHKAAITTQTYSGSYEDMITYSCTTN